MISPLDPRFCLSCFESRTRVGTRVLRYAPNAGRVVLGSEEQNCMILFERPTHAVRWSHKSHGRHRHRGIGRRIFAAVQNNYSLVEWVEDPLDCFEKRRRCFAPMPCADDRPCVEAIVSDLSCLRSTFVVVVTLSCRGGSSVLASLRPLLLAPAIQHKSTKMTPLTHLIQKKWVFERAHS